MRIITEIVSHILRVSKQSMPGAHYTLATAGATVGHLGDSVTVGNLLQDLETRRWWSSHRLKQKSNRAPFVCNVPRQYQYEWLSSKGNVSKVLRFEECKQS